MIIEYCIEEDPMMSRICNIIRLDTFNNVDIYGVTKHSDHCPIRNRLHVVIDLQLYHIVCITTILHNNIPTLVYFQPQLPDQSF
ncbi:hypothetical protein GDO81_014638 [Engystomops pustulosus]|uniref:Uncharacterized protein n=1 Tax=Engystomops pustulosus TaxID=76066 RepID=A0AAV7BBQ4_ENGPU|nr:hypothetical protein GDO81_014638 [Engystomops pustulosus]